jgi:protein O-GlcNAc transferase
MLAPTLSPQASSSHVDDQNSAAGTGVLCSCGTALSHASTALVEYLADRSDISRKDKLATTLLSASEAVAALPRQDPGSSVVLRVRELVAALTRAGVLAQVFTADEATEQTRSLRSNWPGVLARMLVQPSWRAPRSQSFDHVPDWLWQDFGRWVFTPPARFSAASDWDGFFGALIVHLTELNRWVNRNAGSAAVRAAVQAYIDHATGLPQIASPSRLNEYVALRGRLLTRFFMGTSKPVAPELYMRAGRRLRVGFVQTQFGPNRTTYAVVPYFEHLDCHAFDVSLFALTESQSPEAEHCERSGHPIKILPPSLEARIERFQEEQLDVIVFGENLAEQFNDVTRLALHRLAPLQISTGSRQNSLGLPEIDLFVAGASSTGSALPETTVGRAGRLSGPVSSFGILPLGPEQLAGHSREALQLPRAEILLGLVVTSSGMFREQLASCVRVLESTVGTSLVVGFLPLAEGEGPEAFCSEIDGLLAEHGVTSSRVIVVPVTVDAAGDVLRLITVADVLLAPEANAGDLWIAQALSAGIPVVSAGAGAAMFQATGSEELLGRDATEFVALAREIATDASRRADLSARIKTAISAGPDFTDTLAASDAFGSLIETAFDELSALGRAEFRGAREPLSCFRTENLSETIEAGCAALARSDTEAAAFECNLALRTDPTSAQARLLKGRVLLAEGNAGRAVDYLLAAVERAGGSDSSTWFALAEALRANDQGSQAIQALEACLRTDPANLDALLLVIEIAQQVGATEIARDAFQGLQQLAPNDPRVVAMADGFVSA